MKENEHIMMEACHCIGSLTLVVNMCVLKAQHWKLWARLQKSLCPQIANFSNQDCHVCILISQKTSFSPLPMLIHASSYSCLSCTFYRAYCVCLLQGFFLWFSSWLATFFLVIYLHRHIILIAFRLIRNYKSPVFQLQLVGLISNISLSFSP